MNRKIRLITAANVFLCLFIGISVFYTIISSVICFAVLHIMYMLSELSKKNELKRQFKKRR